MLSSIQDNTDVYGGQYFTFDSEGAYLCYISARFDGRFIRGVIG